MGLAYLKDVNTLKLERGKCNGCNMCTVVCPHEVFIMIEKRSFIQNKNSCMECGACAMNCPTGAITVRSGVGCAAGIINGIIMRSEPTCGCSDSGSNCC
ncbi:MAG: 4Fe-4S binding protein [Bacteroidetes bacterium]|nr:4Fe-4S binding protein [Bacteroidota bacterium]